jgi:hypothetical protein
MIQRQTDTQSILILAAIQKIAAPKQEKHIDISLLFNIELIFANLE